jgi:hypothetical protein
VKTARDGIYGPRDKAKDVEPDFGWVENVAYIGLDESKHAAFCELDNMDKSETHEHFTDCEPDEEETEEPNPWFQGRSPSRGP